jgi:hypothetical protein
LSNRQEDVLGLAVWENLNDWPERRLLMVEKVLETVVELEFLVLFGNQKMKRPETLGLDRNILVIPGEIELSVTLSRKIRRSLA